MYHVLVKHVRYCTSSPQSWCDSTAACRSKVRDMYMSHDVLDLSCQTRLELLTVNHRCQLRVHLLMHGCPRICTAQASISQAEICCRGQQPFCRRSGAGSLRCSWRVRTVSTTAGSRSGTCSAVCGAAGGRARRQRVATDDAASEGPGDGGGVAGRRRQGPQRPRGGGALELGGPSLTLCKLVVLRRCIRPVLQCALPSVLDPLRPRPVMHNSRDLHDSSRTAHCNALYGASNLQYPALHALPLSPVVAGMLRNHGEQNQYLAAAGPDNARKAAIPLAALTRGSAHCTGREPLAPRQYLGAVLQLCHAFSDG